MIGRAHAADVFGIDGYVITVEAAIGPGLPGLTIVGESEGRPLHRAGLRARAALEGCCRLPVPQREIVNLAPGERRKDGTGVDLAIACALLVCYGVIPAASLAGVLVWGELAPDGSVLPGVGTLIVADTAHRSGFRVLVLASSCAGEAAPIVGLDVLPVSDLSELIGHLRGEAVIDTSSDPTEVTDALRLALSSDFRSRIKGKRPPFGDGHAAEKIGAIMDLSICDLRSAAARMTCSRRSASINRELKAALNASQLDCRKVQMAATREWREAVGSFASATSSPLISDFRFEI